MLTMGVTVAQKKSRLFPVAFLAAKATLAALKLTNHEGGTLPALLLKALILHFWETLLSQSRLSFITGTNGKTTTNNLLNDLLADNGYQTVTNRVGGNISSGFASSFARTPRGRVRQRLSLQLWSLTSSLDLAFSRTCSLIFCLLPICSAIHSLAVQRQTTCLTLWIRAFLLQLI